MKTEIGERVVIATNTFQEKKTSEYKTKTNKQEATDRAFALITGVERSLWTEMRRKISKAAFECSLNYWPSMVETWKCGREIGYLKREKGSGLGCKK